MRHFPFILVVLFAVSISGCLKQGGIYPPISEVPQVLIDYVENTTKIYLRGVGDYRYDAMNISVYDRAGNTYTNVSENNTYFLSSTTTSLNFSLTLECWSSGGHFYYLGNFTHIPSENTLIIEEKGRSREVSYASLPYKTTLEMIK